MKKHKDNGEIICEIKTKNLSLLTDFVNGKRINTVIEFQSFFLEHLQKIFP